MSARASDFVEVLPPAPHVTLTNNGRNECAMRERRAWRFAKPCETSQTCSWCMLLHSWRPHLLSLWREELEGEIGAVLGQRGDLVDNPV